MKKAIVIAAVAAAALLIWVGGALAVSGTAVPRYEPDPSWPKPLPDNWMFGQVSGTAVDAHDHIWVIQIGRAHV